MAKILRRLHRNGLAATTSSRRQQGSTWVDLISTPPMALHIRAIATSRPKPWQDMSAEWIHRMKLPSLLRSGSRLVVATLVLATNYEVDQSETSNMDSDGCCGVRDDCVHHWRRRAGPSTQ